MELAPDAGMIKRKQDEVMGEKKYRFDENFTPRPLMTKESPKDKFPSHTETQMVPFTVFVTAPTGESILPASDQP